MWKELGDMIKCYGLDEKVLLHGHQPDLLSIMGASDIFVLTSWSEGMPMSLLEAMSLGLIPVCTKVGGIQEVIAEGFNGFMVDVNDNGALAEVLYQVFLMEDGQRKEMGIRARETIMREYSMDTYIARIQTLYEEVMGKA